MTEQILEYLDYAGHGMNLFAVAVILVGFAMAAGHYAWKFRAYGPERDFKQFKIELGRALTLALEILVLADVIDTITTEPSFLSLSVLAFLVVIRTILSWTLTLETEGRWPWQPESPDPNDSTLQNGELTDA
jgi:uncharacterized membrane protein